MSTVLYLIPVTLGDSPVRNVIPDLPLDIILQLEHFVVEDLRSARRYLRKAGLKTDFDAIRFYLLNEHSGNEELDDMYNDEERFGKFSIMLTLLALFIASLGLVGLTSYLAEQKTKEIGVRRAMGASIMDIFIMLSGEFFRIILFSNLIAWPIAYFISHYWLNGFTKHISLNIILYLAASLFIIIITLVIISYRAIVSSLENPAETLRYE